MPDDPGGSSSPSKRLVQDERKTHPRLAQLLGHVVGGGRDILVGQAEGTAPRWFGKLSISVVLGDLERLLGPVGWLAGLPFFLLSLGAMSDQIGGDALRASFELVDELGVPEVVKISGSEAGRRYLLVCRHGHCRQSCAAADAGRRRNEGETSAPRLALRGR